MDRDLPKAEQKLGKRPELDPRSIKLSGCVPTTEKSHPATPAATDISTPLLSWVQTRSHSWVCYPRQSFIAIHVLDACGSGFVSFFSFLYNLQVLIQMKYFYIHPKNLI